MKLKELIEQLNNIVIKDPQAAEYNVMVDTEARANQYHYYGILYAVSEFSAQDCIDAGVDPLVSIHLFGSG